MIKGKNYVYLSSMERIGRYFIFSFVFLLLGGFLYAQNEKTPLFFFGKGKIIVRLYTDYFCGPCKSIEDKIEPILKELVKKNIINLTFIDVPIHKYTPLYATYFLYILKKNQDFDHVLSMRNLLFEAASNNIVEKEKLENFLKNRGVQFETFDPRPIFESYNIYLKEDKINSTPTLVVIKKETFKGTKDVLEVLKKLAQK